MTTSTQQEIIHRIEASGGIIPLQPALVARDWLPPGRRLGLPEEAYDAGERGFISERWIASTTSADSADGVVEGLSYLGWDGAGEHTLADLVAQAPSAVLGEEYAATHPQGLGVLTKLFDYATRLHYHIHPREQHSRLVGRNPKDEAYYFPPDVDLGPQPESFFGLHPSLTEAAGREALLPHLVAWQDDAVLELAQGVRIEPDTGFLIPSGILHAPGSALTIEMQEPSDSLAMLQAVNAGRPISKEMMFKDVRPQDRTDRGESFLLDWVDWEQNADPYFYENHVTRPQRIRESEDAREHWIFYGTPKFSGKRTVVLPGRTHILREAGAHAVLAWRGRGSVGDRELLGGVPGSDEVFVTHSAATSGVRVQNPDPAEDLVLYQFFGPDINDTPSLPRTSVPRPA